MYPEKRKSKEEYAITLDFLPNGYPFDTKPSHRKTPIVQAIGKEHFTVLELVPKKDIFLQPLEEVYIGDGKRDKIHHINGKLAMDRLTPTAAAELKFVVKSLVEKSEAQYVEFFNNAQPMTTRMHQIELLPGVGKKHMWEILEARKEAPFASFKDIKDRVKLMPDPKEAVIRRIINELSGKEKHLMFIER